MVVTRPAHRRRAGALTYPALAAPAQADDSPWRAVAVPPAAAQARLTAVSALNAHTAWAVGQSAPGGDTDTGPPLVLRWNGAAWRKTALPGVTWPGGLRSVAAVGARQAWATGDGGHLLRWNGSRWAEASYPGQGSGVGAVKVFAKPGLRPWLLTSVPISTGTGPGLMRWTGTTWAAVPNPPSAQVITGIRVLGAHDVWIAGATSYEQSGGSFVAHWNGTSWHELPAYDANAYDGFVDVAPLSDTNVWAVGSGRGFGTMSPIVPVLAHWDGTTWTPTPLQWIPSPAGVNVGSVTSLATDPAGRPAWITFGDTYGTPPHATPYARFEGGRWVERFGPADPATTTPLMAVARIPGTSAYWSVGTTSTASVPVTPRIERTG
jgi:hypothetical protein